MITQTSGVNAERLLASVRRILPVCWILVQILMIKHSARPKNARGVLEVCMGELAQDNVIAQDHNVLSSLIPIAAPGCLKPLAP